MPKPKTSEGLDGSVSGDLLRDQTPRNKKERLNGLWQSVAQARTGIFKRPEGGEGGLQALMKPGSKPSAEAC